MIRIGTYNVNNLFSRAKAMELEGFSEEGAKVLADLKLLNGLLERKSYAGDVGRQIVGILEAYDLHKPRTEHWFEINQIRNKLYSVKRDNSGVTLAASGRGSWIGWAELTRKTADEAAIDNTGRVIKCVSAHVLCVVEVEDRLTLQRFSDGVLKAQGIAYPHNLLVDGNDGRGIDVGVLSQFEIRSVRSHIDDGLPKGRIFSRDCPEYEIALPDGKGLWLLCNHLKSKGYGSTSSSNARRKKQADRIAEILKRFDLTADYVAVAGDFNDTPDSPPLAGLIGTENLSDVLSSDKLQGPRWTYRTGRDQIDYLLVSKPLWEGIKFVGIERRGIFSRDDFGGEFDHFPEVTGSVSQASDHAAVWADFDI